jgi:hypothetical protein
MGLVLVPWYLGRPGKIPAAAPTVVAELTGAPFTTPEPLIRPAPHRDSPRESLTGPMFVAQDGKVDMKLRGLPFTFLTPRSWGCLAASVGVDAKAWRCIDESAGPARPQIDLVLRHCPDVCTEAQRAEVNRAMKHPPTYVAAREANIRFIERTVDGSYVMTVDRIFASSAGGLKDWLIVIQATARPADKSTVQKIVNDIYSQTL